jgi:hypothetical protein
MIVSIILILSTLFPLAGGIDYDIIHEDSESEVQMFDFENEEMITVIGHEDIDILQIESSKPTIKQNLILEMTVAGEILKTENVSYQFLITDNEEAVYMVMYSNGNCSGVNIRNMDYEPDILIATGAGTDTLTVTVPITNIGMLETYDLIGMTSEGEEMDDEYLSYTDQVPDQDFPWGDGDGLDDWEEIIVRITEPTNNSIVFQTCEINGVSNTDEKSIESMEIQIDSKSSSGWDIAFSNDEWSTWNYKWDTTSVSVGAHILHARAYDGEEYYFDSIMVYVDQQTATAPKTTNSPTLNIGDKFEYKMEESYEEYDEFEDMTVSGSLTLEVKAEDTININGKDYEVYIVDLKSEHTIISDIFSLTDTTRGTLWVRTSDLAMVKEETIYESTEPSDSPFGDAEEYTSHDISTYDPPKDQFNFPIKVCDKWESSTMKTTTSTSSYEGETDTETYTENITIKYECLRTDSISIPAGNFEVFLLNHVEEYEDYWDEEENYEDSDNDGWADEDEEYFGTDPYDPEDYPFKYEDSESIEDGNGTDEFEYQYEESMGEEYDYLYEDYTIEYYSPDIGFWVKMEDYDYNRKVMYSMELTSYQPGENKKPTGHDSSDDFTLQLGNDFEISIIGLALFIIIIVVIILVTVLALRRRRKKLDAVISHQMETEGTDEPEGRIMEVEPLQPPEQK